MSTEKIMRKKSSLVIRGDLFVCLKCGEKHRIGLPMETGLLLKKMAAFKTLHKDCKPAETPANPP
ncbi:MAG TPA: hypothetical protein PL085_11735 [Agriterribacter sp.]|uniref:hypothetical protein n=1 Tax=Agriterribacter sp. TaxID=2821509 RepID=UPI002CC17144|nr:hypothetical protein [Agriterribacter sp.]HRQ17740.1 hypothetical protein [Agriterribacter sp.]